jgi:hypothetical protein
MHNRYKIPKKFPNVICFLNRVKDGKMPPSLRCTYTRVHDSVILTTKDSVFLLEDHNSLFAQDIRGDDIAGRFKNSARHVFAVMEKELASKHGKEVQLFGTWLRNADISIYNKRAVQQMREDAEYMGYKLVEI